LKPSKPPQILLGLLLPLLLLFPSRFPLSKQLTSQVTLLLQIVLVSLAMFFTAHAVMFKLYFPGRYTQHSLRIVMAIAAGIALVIILDAILSWARKQDRITLISSALFLGISLVSIHFYLPLQYRRKGLALLIALSLAIALIELFNVVFRRARQEGKIYLGRQFLALISTAVLSAVIILYPSFLKYNSYPFPNTDYRAGTVPELYKFFTQQPKDSLRRLKFRQEKTLNM
jgi:hypothetical protein